MAVSGTQSRLRAERKTCGLCIQCGSPDLAGSTQKCSRCLDMFRESGRRHIRKLKQEVIAAYGGKCTCCGETIPEFLTIDHINNDGKAHRMSNKMAAGSGTYAWLKRNDYPKDDFQLLCFNCNCAKSSFGSCPHKRNT